MKSAKATLNAEHEALLALAASHRLERAANVEAEASANWQCERGHAWDDSVSAARNVRCMGCASQRLEAQLEKLRAIATERGGQLLISAQTKRLHHGAPDTLQWQCAFGHKWTATAETASKRWCYACWQQGMYESKRTGDSRPDRRQTGISEPASLRQSQKS